MWNKLLIYTALIFQFAWGSCPRSMKLGKDGWGALWLVIGVGEMDNLPCLDVEGLFKLNFSLYFSKFCILLISSWMQLHICCMCKTVKFYKIMHSCNHWQPLGILKCGNVNEIDTLFLSCLQFLSPPFPNPQLMFIRYLLFLGCFVYVDNDFCLASKYLNLWNSDHPSCGGKGRKGKRFLSPCYRMLLLHLICYATSSEYDYKEVVWAFSVSLCSCDLQVNCKP